MAERAALESRRENILYMETILNPTHWPQFTVPEIIRAVTAGFDRGLASGGTVPGMGKACLDWALARCRYLRIDTHGDNIPMQNLLKKLGFTQRGVIHVQEDNDPRLAYDKIRE